MLGETPSCSAVFEDFLKYLYTGKIHLDFATVVPIVSLADKVSYIYILLISYLLFYISIVQRQGFAPIVFGIHGTQHINSL